jgi:energy-coupling factor transporter ATP-binding protein EcfA2
MQLKRFEIRKLFGRLDHKIDFPVSTEDSPKPSLVILHGPNGVGKTTVLKMLAGIMQLNFNIFREVPFEHCSLQFSDNKKITVDASSIDHPHTLKISFEKQSVDLHAQRAGPTEKENAPIVEQLRNDFFAKTNRIKFEFIDTNRLGTPARADRLSPLSLEWQALEESESSATSSIEQALIARELLARSKASVHRQLGALASKVARFIADAQVNYRNFFATTTPDLFPKIIQRLGEEANRYRADDLLARLRFIKERDKHTQRLGLEGDRWDYEQLEELLVPNKSSNTTNNALAVVGTYVEFLESRLAERGLVAERLFTFEQLASELLLDKKVVITPTEGFRIDARGGQSLNEGQLSSGEFHLLYLMVSALVTRRRGTVIAIDEPEMSMHIAWQRRLVSTLFQCASKAEPQFILATHSPDIAAEYPDSMIDLHPGRA